MIYLPTKTIKKNRGAAVTHLLMLSVYKFLLSIHQSQRDAAFNLILKELKNRKK